MEKKLIVPSEIPWETIKGKELEELLYWLVDSMGAKDLQWRKGGKGGGSSDQGRDLECYFYMSNPEGDLSRQKWWIEAKGRKGTVEPSEVKDSVLNAAGKADLDVLVIATNSNFSNPTRDWVKDWLQHNPRPVVRLWEQSMLEKLCSKHPEAVIRLFSKALSPQGKYEVLKTRLWNYSSFADEPTLKELWKNKDQLDTDAEGLLALVVSEFANGNISTRPWPVLFDNENIIQTLANGLINFLYLVSKASDAGIRQEPYIRALSYLTLICIDRVGTTSTEIVLTQIWDDVQGRDYPEEVIEFILEPILDQLGTELRDICTSDCRRVTTDPIQLTEAEIENYWRRLHLPKSEEEEQVAKKVLAIESYKEPCAAGFKVSKDVSCPILSLESPHRNLEETLSIFKKIMRFRNDRAKNDV
jgi:hypothetical protein